MGIFRISVFYEEIGNIVETCFILIIVWYLLLLSIKGGRKKKPQWPSDTTRPISNINKNIHFFERPDF